MKNPKKDSKASKFNEKWFKCFPGSSNKNHVFAPKKDGFLTDVLKPTYHGTIIGLAATVLADGGHHRIDQIHPKGHGTGQATGALKESVVSIARSGHNEIGCPSQQKAVQCATGSTNLIANKARHLGQRNGHRRAWNGEEEEDEIYV